MLRLTRQAECIVHIPKVLYYWRAHPQSTAATTDNKPAASTSGIKAVSDFLEASGVDASVTCSKGAATIYRVAYALPSPPPR